MLQNGCGNRTGLGPAFILVLFILLVIIFGFWAGPSFY